MKRILGVVGLVVVASSALTVAQPAQSTCQDTARVAAGVAAGILQQRGTPASAEAVEQGARMGLIARILKDTAISVAADCIESRPSGFHAQGNVTLSVGDITITADDAVVNGREVQLTGNSRVRLPAK